MHYLFFATDGLGISHVLDASAVLELQKTLAADYGVQEWLAITDSAWPRVIKLLESYDQDADLAVMRAEVLAIDGVSVEKFEV